MPNFQLLDVTRLTYPAVVSTEDAFSLQYVQYNVEKSVPFQIICTLYFAEQLRKILPAYKFWRI
jgi:hypothetical protein